MDRGEVRSLLSLFIPLLDGNGHSSSGASLLHHELPHDRHPRVILGVGLNAKPDLSIETWAHQKVLNASRRRGFRLLEILPIERIKRFIYGWWICLPFLLFC
ncbi:hypothetical protein Bca52824_010082 [Brassica carinata]|uniref:Uncharacterized protein n=1 Tax=Brassica carinata TaxID=52824 RepID=A0A8X8B7E0_BRACI|nr:hypothetical protein Bca52824_010082 [Brassica carinata]